MSKVQIRGRVFPIANTITTGSLPSLHWAEHTDAAPTVFTATILASAFTVECVVESYNPNDCSLLLIRAFQYVRSIVDCLAFSWRLGLTVVLDDLVDPKGDVIKITFANPNLSGLATTFPLSSIGGSTNNFLEMYKVVVGNPALFLSLNDLILAISVPGNVAVGCARAIEGLRSILLPSDETRLRAWEVFRHVLNIDKAYIEYITDASISGRHGSKFDVTQDNAKILNRAWAIMNRFLAFKKQGNMPLAPSAYPMLK